MNKNSTEVIGKVLFTVICCLLALYYTFSENPWTIIDGFNLLIHEAGHPLFSFAGEFMGMLGGTLLQLLVPIGISVYFFTSLQWYAFFYSILWIGINVINISVYMKDASVMALPLVGGGVHDWNTILSELNILSYDQIISNILKLTGIALMFTACIAMTLHCYIIAKDTH